MGELKIDLLEVTIEVTNWCPLNCIHCSTRYSPHYEGEEYNVDIDKVVDDAIKYIKTLNTPIRIRFSGGESLPFLGKKIFRKLKENCPNIKEWIITVSGATPVLITHTLIAALKEKTDDLGINNLIFRISIYGNKKQHTEVTRNFVAYENSITNIEWLLDKNIRVELTSPIFGFWNTINVIRLARKYKVPVRLAKLISTPAIKSKDQKDQLKIAKIAKLLYKETYITCSLYGCEATCDYPKSTVLATGEIIGCAIDKMRCKT